MAAESEVLGKTIVLCNKEPWSKKHKAVTGITSSGVSTNKPCEFSLSNSFAQPLTHPELVGLSLENGSAKHLVEEYNIHSLDYTPNGGSRDLREKIAELYESENVKAGNILVFPGAQVALQVAANAALRKPYCHDRLKKEKTEESDQNLHAIVFSPGYQSTVRAPLHSNLCAHVTEIRLRPEAGWDVKPAEVEQAILDAKAGKHGGKPLETRYMVLNQPYNPAGTLMTKDTFSKIVEIANRYEIWVLCDEIYRGLEHDSQFSSDRVQASSVSNASESQEKHLCSLNFFGNSDTRLPPIASVYARGISLGGLSKPWGGCGITIGWLAFSDGGLGERLIDEQYFGTACPSRASELQALMVLHNSKSILKKNLQIIQYNLNLLDAFLERNSEFFDYGPNKSGRPVAGAICFLRFKGPCSAEEFGAQLAAFAGVSVKPAYCFTDEVEGPQEPDVSKAAVSNGDPVSEMCDGIAIRQKFEAILDKNERTRTVGTWDYSAYFRVGFGEEKMPRALEALEAYVQKNAGNWR